MIVPERGQNKWPSIYIYYWDGGVKHTHADQKKQFETFIFRFIIISIYNHDNMTRYFLWVINIFYQYTNNRQYSGKENNNDNKLTDCFLTDLPTDRSIN